ncbi:hypothetical protein ABTE36_23850, partial [Acinetobacter baumannii]
MASLGEQTQQHLHAHPQPHAHALPRQSARALFCPLALLPDGWQHDVLLRWDDSGRLIEVSVRSPRGEA